MDATELAFAGVARQAELLRAREVSSAELVALHLERIERLDPQLNAFRVVLAERAKAEAAGADQRLAEGADGALLGVPMAVKDTEDVEGELTTLGTECFDVPARADSGIVRSLRSAGAIVIGKTNLPELATSGFTETKGFGVTRNPWDLGRTPGGSSGGSGAAVAAGLVGAASATDGAGSIRIPAAFCSLFGLKPQVGRIPLDPPHSEHWYGLTALGFVTRTVADSALLLDVSAVGVDRPFAEAARTPPGALRIAVSDAPVRALAPPIVTNEVRGALADAEGLLGSLGHRTHREDPRYGQAGSRAITRYQRGIRDDVLRMPNPERLDRYTLGLARLGAVYPRALARRATRRAPADAARINAVLERADVLMTPTIGEPPVEIDRWRGRGAFRTLIGMSRTYCFTPIWNHTGQPAAAIPMGFTDRGLPLSVQLIGRPGDEATLLSLAAQIEAERPWADRRPPLS